MPEWYLLEQIPRVPQPLRIRKIIGVKKSTCARKLSETYLVCVENLCAEARDGKPRFVNYLCCHLRDYFI